MEKKWDLFISYASEDKESFVEPLVEVLTQFGVDVWYDEFSLNPGDSLSRSIDKGLAKSKYGLVIFSPSFLVKKWPEYELRGLITKEIAGENSIIPIWYKLTFEQLAKFSPTLADKLAIRTDDKSILQIGLAIISVIRPDIFTRIHSRIEFYSVFEKAKLSTLTGDDLKSWKSMIGPIRHEQLPPDLIRRIRFIRAALIYFRPLTMKSWIDGFQRDAHPSSEIAIWEKIATVMLEYLSYTKPTISIEQGKIVLEILLLISMGSPVEQLQDMAKNLPENSLNILIQSFLSSEPVIEFSTDDYPIDDKSAANKKDDVFIDKEDFQYNIPDELIRKVINELKTGKDQPNKKKSN